MGKFPGIREFIPERGDRQGLGTGGWTLGLPQVHIDEPELCGISHQVHGTVEIKFA